MQSAVGLTETLRRLIGLAGGEWGQVMDRKKIHAAVTQTH